MDIEIKRILDYIKNIQSYYNLTLGSHGRLDHIYFMTVYMGFLDDQRKKYRDGLQEVYYAHNELIKVF